MTRPAGDRVRELREGERLSPTKPRNVLATTTIARDRGPRAVLLHYPRRRSVPDIIRR